MQTSKFIWAALQTAFSTLLIFLLNTINADLAREFAISAVAKISLVIFVPIYLVLYMPAISLTISALIKTIQTIKVTNKIIKIISIFLLIYLILLIAFLAFLVSETITILV